MKHGGATPPPLWGKVAGVEYKMRQNAQIFHFYHVSQLIRGLNNSCDTLFLWMTTDGASSVKPWFHGKLPTSLVGIGLKMGGFIATPAGNVRGKELLE